MLLDLESLLVLVTLVGTIEGCELNLLFYRKALSLPLNEFGNDLGAKVETLGKFKVLFITSFDSTIRAVEDRLDTGRSGLELRDERAERGRSTLDKFLDRDGSSLDDLEGKEDSSEVVNSFFETKIRLEWTSDLVLVILDLHDFWIWVGN